MRKFIDCRDKASESKCTLRFAGEEDELIRAVAEHSVSVHGEIDSKELRDALRRDAMPEDEMGWRPRTEAPDVAARAR